MSLDALGNFAGKHLVIFGAGYVGSALAAAALKRGVRVTALTRNHDKAARLAQTGAKVVVADLAAVDWHRDVPAAELAVNCVSSGGGGALGYQQSYVEGSRSIVHWAKGVGGVETLLYTSSTSVYPQSGGVVDELAPVSGASGNALLLLNAERVIEEAATKENARACRHAVVLRLSGIYGPGRHHVLDQLRAGVRPLPGRGEHRLNLIYRDDILSAIALALAGASGASAPAYSLFNVTDDLPVRKTDLVSWLTEKIGVPFPGFSGEAVPGRRADPPDRAVSNAKIGRELSWRPAFPNYRIGYEMILGA